MEATLMTPLKARARRWAGGALGAVALLALAVVPAKANDGDARKKAMSDYVAGQKSLSATHDADIEVVTPDLQKVQFTASGTVLIERPAGLRATRTGAYADVELVFDGKAATVHNRGRTGSRPPASPAARNSGSRLGAL